MDNKSIVWIDKANMIVVRGLACFTIEYYPFTFIVNFTIFAMKNRRKKEFPPNKLGVQTV
jgi:hypothetical protein